MMPAHPCYEHKERLKNEINCQPVLFENKNKKFLNKIIYIYISRSIQGKRDVTKQNLFQNAKGDLTFKKPGNRNHGVNKFKERKKPNDHLIRHANICLVNLNNFHDNLPVQGQKETSLTW